MKHTSCSGYIKQQRGTSLAGTSPFDKYKIQNQEVHHSKCGDSGSEVDKKEQANVALRKYLPRYHGCLRGEYAGHHATGSR
jgi:hypothetical protein